METVAQVWSNAHRWIRGCYETMAGHRRNRHADFNGMHDSVGNINRDHRRSGHTPACQPVGGEDIQTASVAERGLLPTRRSAPDLRMPANPPRLHLRKAHLGDEQVNHNNEADRSIR
jgi:hypothetical protein